MLPQDLYFHKGKRTTTLLPEMEIMRNEASLSQIFLLISSGRVIYFFGFVRRLSLTRDSSVRQPAHRVLFRLLMKIHSNKAFEQISNNMFPSQLHQ